MTRRRLKRRADKARRHLQPSNGPHWPVEPQPLSAAPPRIVVREASHVERLAYTRSQAAEALGISRSTLRRLIPYIETIELPWGRKLIPVDELERLAAERRSSRSRRVSAGTGRKPSISTEVVERITTARAAGASYRSIAASLDRDRVPTAHGGKRWWPSTIRAVVERRLDIGSSPSKTGQLRSN